MPVPCGRCWYCLNRWDNLAEAKRIEDDKVDAFNRKANEAWRGPLPDDAFARAIWRWWWLTDWGKTRPWFWWTPEALAVQDTEFLVAANAARPHLPNRRWG